MDTDRDRSGRIRGGRFPGGAYLLEVAIREGRVTRDHGDGVVRRAAGGDPAMGWDWMRHGKDD